MILASGVEGSWDGQTEVERACILIVSPEYLFMQKRAGSGEETEQGLPLKYSRDHLHASLHSQASWGLWECGQKVPLDKMVF